MKILLIGGGTGGHILPLRNLADELLKRNVHVELVVADQPIDRQIIAENFTDLPVHFFKVGKIRRYASLRNFLDFFSIIRSFWTAQKMLENIKPDALFFKGGFVGFSFWVAAKFLVKFHGKMFVHESDISSGATTKFVAKSAHTVFRNFGKNATPLFFTPPLERSAQESASGKKKLLIMGGSQGAEFLNKVFLECHDKILQEFSVFLVSGPGKKISIRHDNFEQAEFLPALDLARRIQAADVIISRAGANSLLEIIAARKPSIIIPLPSSARNHQVENAQYFSQKNLCHFLSQDEATPKTLLSLLRSILQDKKMRAALEKEDLKNAAGKIAEKILQNT